jgi:hypothetical protein
MTGSVGISGSLSVNGVSTLTGALSGTSATFSGADLTVNGASTQPFLRVSRTGSGAHSYYWGINGGSTLFLQDETAGVTRITLTAANVMTLSSDVIVTGTLNSGALIGTSASFSSTVIATSYVEGSYFQISSAPATSGGVRLGTQVAIRARNVANTANIPLIESSAADKVSIDSGGAGTVLGGALSGTSATFSDNITSSNANSLTFVQLLNSSAGGKVWTLASAGASNVHSVPTGSFYLRNSSDNTTPFQIASTGAATFSSSVTANTYVEIIGNLILNSTSADRKIYFRGSGATPDTNWSMGTLLTPTGATVVTAAATVIDVYGGGGSTYGFMVRNTSNTPLLQIAGSTGAATFSSTVSSQGGASTITGGAFTVDASTTKTVTVAFNGGNIHAFLGFSSESGGVTGSGSKSIFVGGTTNDGSGHTPTVISTFSYGDQTVGAGTTNTGNGFTFTITNGKASSVTWRWSAFGYFSTLTVT